MVKGRAGQGQGKGGGRSRGGQDDKTSVGQDDKTSVESDPVLCSKLDLLEPEVLVIAVVVHNVPHRQVLRLLALRQVAANARTRQRPAVGDVRTSGYGRRTSEG